ncbi:DNA-binding transcriptional regulator, MarR family [Actinopolymorpha cephalotaxi]|uniref:DNA-binding MarR family transcriptional regulator n=1 Tax=Actinopolymorpha cephalotaxi TaxID=504797 RepID=A0A1I2PHG9_9ACTN|nr:MarR family transcriptional regulator [Actinopolymorpha cephalotaxi]NYH83607.1 DNA-binding MarR family transcriptional regulator [Actinopolymorpha cephalotaxi]SFG15494.1 DNA-binding transcriptional regulator, MarR family [Actinopolymorpha cephalotaxi]
MTAMAPARAEPDLSFLLDHTSHVLRTRMAAALGEIGLTARMHCVLVHALAEERTQIQLAELGDMDKTTMVVTVDALEQAGLAQRQPSSTDRRARIVAVTKEGARMARRSQRVVDRVHQEALAALPAQERKAFLHALERLTTGHLAEPVEAPRPVRRARQRES